MSVSTDSGAPLHEEDGYLIPSLSPLPEGSAEAEEEEEASEDPSRGDTTPESESESDFHNFSEIADSNSRKTDFCTVLESIPGTGIKSKIGCLSGL